MPQARTLIRVGTMVAFSMLVGCQVLGPNILGVEPTRTASSAVPSASSFRVAAAEERIKGQYIVTFKGGRVPKNYAASVRAAGGTLMKTLDQLGFALVKSEASGYAQRLAQHADVESVTPNVLVTIPGSGVASGQSYVQAKSVGPSAQAKQAPGPTTDARRVKDRRRDDKNDLDCDFNPKGPPFEPEFHLPPVPLGDPFDLTFQGPPDPSGPSGEPLSGYQWGMRTTRAAKAWCKGFTGKGVVVAVLDTGIDPDNPDLRPNLDVRRSISFVDSEPTFVDFNGHGCHTAGIVAAARNNFGVTGIAPEATVIAVKVIDQTGSGSVFGVLQGMVYGSSPRMWCSFPLGLSTRSV